MAVPVAHERILRHEGGQVREVEDILVTEEPLEIRLGHGPLDEREEFRLSVTMRTPGNDEELALGFLFTEGLITGPEEVIRVAYCEDVKPEERGNVVRVELRLEVELDPAKWQRNFYTTSSCGVCGKSSIEAVQATCARPIAPWGDVDPVMITALPDRMREAQTVFRHTGGIHAAALFDRTGKLLLLREDVGRHNAVDKVVGRLLLDGRLPATGLGLFVSGRASFEMVQKAWAAGFATVLAVSAPTALAVDTARRANLFLAGFIVIPWLDPWRRG